MVVYILAAVCLGPACKSTISPIGLTCKANLFSCLWHCLWGETHWTLLPLRAGHKGPLDQSHSGQATGLGGCLQEPGLRDSPLSSWLWEDKCYGRLILESSVRYLGQNQCKCSLWSRSWNLLKWNNVFWKLFRIALGNSHVNESFRSVL